MPTEAAQKKDLSTSISDEKANMQNTNYRLHQKLTTPNHIKHKKGKYKTQIYENTKNANTKKNTHKST